MTKNLLKRLFAVLEKEIVLYEDELTISEKKKQIIVAGNVEELEKINQVEQMLIFKLGKYEIEREETVIGICSELGLNEENATINDIAALLDNNDSIKLIDLKSKLRSIVGDLKNINELNTKLIQNSLEYIDFSINAFASAKKPTDNNYNPEGILNDTALKPKFDVKW